MSHSEWNTTFPLYFGSDPLHQASLTLVAEGAPARPVLEQFIQARFSEAHGAEVAHFMPELIGLHAADHSLQAVAGARLAEREELFLEQYLNEPVQMRISRLAGRAVPREAIVEVGNLAASSAGSARLIIIAMTSLLARRGLEWVVFTGAASLINSFRRLGLEPLRLCEADPLRLGEQRLTWGDYYEQHPQVFAGSITLGFRQLQQQGVLQRLGFTLPSREACHAA
ncbi:thermostable hemolysin [Aquipseudomonas ullengensis]|uniref:Thermostable hemolysin n=1 Tax=Aquipseudomonas ullengensis TaxID=2759166 RepID=A0A7W4LLG9_9GAMM|nr:thermostable hemolysin [Pseudomonas ullengensis]MBB2495187.1 thermostable hemolysin [Pseudomonas ullengensis]